MREPRSDPAPRRTACRSPGAGRKGFVGVAGEDGVSQLVDGDEDLFHAGHTRAGSSLSMSAKPLGAGQRPASTSARIA